MLSGALRADLGKQRRTASRQTATGISTAQQRDGDGPYRWSGAGRCADAAMSTELLIALGVPLAYLLVSTAILLKGDIELPRFVQRLNSRDALLWNTMVAVTIAIGALRWALNR